MKRVLVVHGPNLNMLGQREPEIYGFTTLAEINDELKELGAEWGLNVEVFQSNHEGVLIDKLQETFGTIEAIIINPGALTHYSIALRDALSLYSIPIVEVHLSNIHAREEFRNHSITAPVVTGVVAGLGHHGYYLALQAIKDKLGED